MQLMDVKLDGDNDSLLFQARPQGPDCRHGTDTYWGGKSASSFEFLYYLEEVITDRNE